MKKILLGTIALITLGLAAPASAADMAARPYTKAPAPMIAAIYDWSGFYIGANGGWGSSRNCYTNTAIAGIAVAPTAEGCHDATGGTAGGQIGYRWQTGNCAFGLGPHGSTFTSVRPVAGLNTRTGSVKQDADLVTVRVNYRWGGPVIANY